MLLCLTLVVVATPIAIAAEDDPDCESGQPWIGYNANTAAAKAAYTAAGSPGGLNICEGEHWDGQDSVSDRDATSCDPVTNLDANALHVNRCMGEDPNTVPGDVLSATLGIRASVNGAQSGEKQVYAASSIPGVGRAAVYVDEGSVAVYLRDNTVTDNGENVLATVISAARLTRGFPDEGDCDQETYTRSANGEVDSDGNPVCHRDNTAATVEHSLLA